MFERIVIPAMTAARKKKKLTGAQKAGARKLKHVFEDWEQGGLKPGKGKRPSIPYAGKRNAQVIAIALSEKREAEKEYRKKHRKK